MAASALGIELYDGYLEDAEAERVNQLAEEHGSFYREYMVWMALYEAAQCSIERGCAIVFV